MISDDEIREIIADCQNKIGDYNAIVDGLEELLKYRSIIDMGPDVENADAEKYLPTSQMSGYMGE